MRRPRLDAKPILSEDGEGARAFRAQRLDDLAAALPHLTVIATARALGRKVPTLRNPIRVWINRVDWARIRVMWVCR